MPTAAPAPEGAEGMLVSNETIYAYVNVSANSSLTLRKAPNTAALPVAYLKRGTQVQLLAFNDTWAYVRTAGGTSGFAARMYLYLPGSDSGSQPVVTDTPKEDTNTNTKKFKEIKTDVVFCKIAARTKTQTKVYQSNSTSSKQLGVLPISAKVTVWAYNKQWAYIGFGSSKGFVPIQSLKKE